eukprot:712304-Rhodomonas_salina.1
MQGEELTALRPVAYYSRQFKETGEHNYTMHLTGRLVRWFEFLAEYNITEILHIPGKDKVVADALSRRLDYAKVAALFAVMPLHQGYTVPHSDTFKRFLEVQCNDPLCQQLRQDLEDPKNKPDCQLRACYSITDNGALVWTAKGKQRRATTGHECGKTCTAREIPFLKVSFDFMGPLPMSTRGNNMMFNVTDFASRTIHCVPCFSSRKQPISAQATAQLYFDHLFRTQLMLGIQDTASEVLVFMKRLVSLISAAHDRILQIQVKQAEALSARLSNVEYRVGNFALLSTANLALTSQSKFTPKFLGLFKVLEVKAGGNAVKLELPPTMNQIHPVISIGRLRKFKVPDPDTGPLLIPQLPPVFKDQSGQYYAVESIVAEQIGWSQGQNVKCYAISWKGYGPESDSWLTHEALARDCPEAIAHWEALQRSILQRALRIE